MNKYGPKALSTQRLLDYCKKHGITLPQSASREMAEAAIARAMLHENEAVADAEIGCFGNWSDFDRNCAFCDFESSCYKASMGIDKKRYDAFIAKLENPQVRFIAMRRTQRMMARRRKDFKEDK